MRLELQFELKEPVLPKDNKSIWVSFLKNILSTCADGRYYSRYYDGVSPKDFSFSIILPQPKFVDNYIELGGTTVKMIFSADERGNTGLIFYAGFLEAKKKYFPLPNGNGMTLVKVNLKKEHNIVDHTVLFKTVTGGGVVVRNHNAENNRDRFYSYDEEEFLPMLKRVVENELIYAKFPEYLINDVTVNVISCKKVLVKQYDIYVDVNVGIFQIDGHPDVLNYLYQAGLGSKRSMGYGLLDVISKE